MHFAPAFDKDDDTKDSPVATRASGARSILRVPSLGSACGTESHGGRLPEVGCQQPDVSPPGYRSAPGFGYRPDPMSWLQDRHQQHPHQQQHHQQHPHQQQRQHQQHQHQQYHHQHQQHHHQQQHQQEAAFWMANQGGAMRQHPSTHGNMPVPTTYSPVGIRSGRGAARLPVPRRSEALPSATASASTSASALAPTGTSTSRPSYPVSNRGKGSRHNASRRGSPVANATVSGAVAQAFIERVTVADGCNNATRNNTSAEVFDKSVKQVQQPPTSILKRRFSSVACSKPAGPAMEEKKDDDDSGSVSA